MSDGMTDSSRGYHVARDREEPKPGEWYVREYDGHPDFHDHVFVHNDGHRSFVVSSWSEGERLCELLNKPTLEGATRKQLQQAINRLDKRKKDEDREAEELRQREIEAARRVLRKHGVD